MRNLINKKGISDVVAIVLIILIVIASSVIMYVGINKFISDELPLSPESCLDMLKNPPLSITGACYNSDEGSVEVVLKRSSLGSDLRYAEFLIEFDSGNSRTWRCGSNSDVCETCILLDKGITRTYSIPFDGEVGRPVEVEIVAGECSMGVLEIEVGC